MESIRDLQFENIWKKKDSELRSKVSEMWLSSRLLTQGEIDQRLDDIVIVLKTPEGKVVGVTTIYKDYLKLIEQHVYLFRCMILPEYRAPGLDTTMVLKTRDFLESFYKKDVEPRCVGMAMVVQNEEIKKTWKQAIWPGIDMVFLGVTPQGHHLRIYYFKGATI